MIQTVTMQCHGVTRPGPSRSASVTVVTAVPPSANWVTIIRDYFIEIIAQNHVIIFSILHIICFGWTGMWALQVRPTHCTSTHTHSEYNNELLDHQGSCCQCGCRRCPNCYDYSRLFYIISRLLRLFYRLYAIISRHRHPENGNVQTAILHPIME